MFAVQLDSVVIFRFVIYRLPLRSKFETNQSLNDYIMHEALQVFA